MISLLPHERQNKIIKLLYESRSVKISYLTKYFGVTRETIRKDLYSLEEQDLVQKIHGGAILKKAKHETSYINRKEVNDDEKKLIAKKAAEKVIDGDTLYIDYGTTCSYFVNEILSKKNLTVMTASLPIANTLSDYSDFDVIIIGGIIRKNEKSLYGPMAGRYLQDTYVDKGIFGIGGVDLHAGYTNFHLGESEISKIMVKNSQKTIIMADYSKFNNVAMNKIASFKEIDLLITDDKVDMKIIKKMKEKKDNIIVVDSTKGDKSNE